MKKCAWLLLCVFFTAPMPAVARTWTDTEGHSVVGEFDRVLKGRVLINVGDRTIQVPFGHLISEDQDFVRDQLKAHGLQDQVPAKKKTADADTTTEAESSAKEPAAEAPAKLGPTRTWTDVQGRKIQARFIGIDGGNVRLQFKGKNTSYPFDKFSLADQQYVRGEMVARGDGDKAPAGAPPPNAQPVRNAPAQYADAAPLPVFPGGGSTANPQPAMPAAPRLPEIESSTFAAPPQQAPGQPPPMRPAPFTPPAPPQFAQSPPPSFAPNLPGNQQTTAPVMIKKCTKCGAVVPNNLTAGDCCPTCGAYFEYDDTNGQRKTNHWGYYATPSGIGAIVVVVIGMLLRARRS
jgi:hypothetical protein